MNRYRCFLAVCVSNFRTLRGEACSYAHTSQELREVRRLVLPLAESEVETEPNFCSPYVAYVPAPNSPSPSCATKTHRAEGYGSMSGAQEATYVPNSADCTPPKTLFIPLPTRGGRPDGMEEKPKQDDEASGASTPGTPLLTDHPQLTAAFQQGFLHTGDGFTWPHLTGWPIFPRAETSASWIEPATLPDRSFDPYGAASSRSDLLLHMQAPPASQDAYLPFAAGRLQACPYPPQHGPQLCPLVLPVWNQFVTSAVLPSPELTPIQSPQYQYQKTSNDRTEPFC